MFFVHADLNQRIIDDKLFHFNQIADLIVSHFSTVGNDCIVPGIPVFAPGIFVTEFTKKLSLFNCNGFSNHQNHGFSNHQERCNRSLRLFEQK